MDGYTALKREVTAIKIPEGATKLLPAETLVAITEIMLARNGEAGSTLQ